MPVLRTLGGCGGTLAARVLGALPKVVLLSECNPRSARLFDGLLNPLEQLRRNRPELVADEPLEPADLHHPEAFGDFLLRLNDRTTDRGECLVVRDYGYVDYVGVPFVDRPPMDSSLDAALGQVFTVHEALLVRRPDDQTASLLQHGVLTDVLRPRQVLDGYVAFLRQKPAIPIVRYEDLVSRPAQAFAGLCAALNLTFHPEALSDMSAADRLTGNLTRIADPISAPVPSDLRAGLEQAFLQDLRYPALLSRLGYA